MRITDSRYFCSLPFSLENCSDRCYMRIHSGRSQLDEQLGPAPPESLTPMPSSAVTCFASSHRGHSQRLLLAILWDTYARGSISYIFSCMSSVFLYYIMLKFRNCTQNTNQTIYGNLLKCHLLYTKSGRPRIPASPTKRKILHRRAVSCYSCFQPRMKQNTGPGIKDAVSAPRLSRNSPGTLDKFKHSQHQFPHL